MSAVHVIAVAKWRH